MSPNTTASERLLGHLKEHGLTSSLKLSIVINMRHDDTRRLLQQLMFEGRVFEVEGGYVLAHVERSSIVVERSHEELVLAHLQSINGHKDTASGVARATKLTLALATATCEKLLRLGEVSALSVGSLRLYQGKGEPSVTSRHQVQQSQETHEDTAEANQ
ncbi:hypothetical protein [Deinococcus pimensis]|uniref:hypothetical protein n=1 Tax=Deinococcus pimensis TaxID=309888 RepID=UPI000481BD55|nr:hypothetical protein [Deinococcus pimensis]